MVINDYYKLKFDDYVKKIEDDFENNLQVMLNENKAKNESKKKKNKKFIKKDKDNDKDKDKERCEEE